MAVRPPVTPPAPPARVYPVRLVLDANLAQGGTTVEALLTAAELRAILAGTVAFIRIPDGTHPHGHARFVGLQAIAQLDIIGVWPPEAGEDDGHAVE